MSGADTQSNQLLSIVVVDDNLDDAFRVHCCLNEISGINCRFVHYRDPWKGQEELTKTPCDYVFVDSDLRTETGTDFIKTVRSSGCDAPIIVLCTAGDEARIAEMMRVGADDCILKQDLSADAIKQALETAQKHVDVRRMERYQRDLLTRTLTASVRILVEMLSTLKPAAFGRARRARDIVRQFSEVLENDRIWEYEIAAMLSQIGCLHIPDHVLNRVQQNQPLTEVERKLFAQHPSIGQQVIATIPRLTGVARIVAFQERHYDGSGPPNEAVEGKGIPEGSRVLKIALDLQSLLGNGFNAERAFELMKNRGGVYDRELLEKFREVMIRNDAYILKEVAIHDITKDMLLDEHVSTDTGMLIASKGTALNSDQIRTMVDLVKAEKLPGTVHVRIPRAAAI